MCSRLQRADAERGNAGTCWKRDAGIPMISTSRKYVASLETHVASCSKSRNICCESQICNIRPQLSKLIFGFISNCLLFLHYSFICVVCVSSFLILTNVSYDVFAVSKYSPSFEDICPWFSYTEVDT